MTLRSGTLTVDVRPEVTAEQHVTILLSGTGAGGPGFTLVVPPGNGVVPSAATVGTVAAPFTRVPAGRYLVRVEVDGAESLPGMTGGVFATGTGGDDMTATAEGAVTWAEENSARLAAEVARVRARLLAACGRGGPDDVAAADAAAAARSMPADELEPGLPSPLEVLRRVFALTDFERDLLLLAAAYELDPGVGGVPRPATFVGLTPPSRWRCRYFRTRTGARCRRAHRCAPGDC